MSLNVKPSIPLSNEKLNNIILGRDQTISRNIGFTLLRLSERNDKVSLMKKVLMNEAEEPRYRCAAAQNLYMMNDEASHEVLLSASRSISDPRALVGVVKVLGRIGDVNALEAIEKIIKEMPDSEPLARQAQFAAVLLAYRYGLPGHDLKVTGELLNIPSEEGIQVRIDKPEDMEARLCLDSLESESFGIKINPTSFQQLQCKSNLWMVVLNEEFNAIGALEKLQQRKTLFGMLASKSSESGRYSIVYLILTSPADERGQVRLLLTHTNGKPGFSGKLQLSDQSTARFELQSRAEPGVFALRAQGIFDSTGRLEIQDVISALTIPQKRHPRPIVPQRTR